MLRDYLKKIEKSSLQLQSRLNDLMETSRSENGEYELEFTPTDLCLSFERLSELFQEPVRRKRISFSVHTSQVQHPYVWCDKKDLDQLLSDIISNSCKISPEGGTVSASICETGSGENGYSTYEMRFQDSGAGVSAPEQNTEGGTPETGSGLAAVKSIIDRMGGNAEIFSSPGNGMEILIRFKFRLASRKDMKKEIAVAKISG